MYSKKSNSSSVLCFVFGMKDMILYRPVRTLNTKYKTHFLSMRYN
jgi:hypothetical protein